MSRALLLCDNAHDWLAAVNALGFSEYLSLKLDLAHLGLSGYVRLVRESEVVKQAFVGAESALGDPIGLLTAAMHLLPHASGDCAILAEDYAARPVLRHTFLLLSGLLGLDRVYCRPESPCLADPWPVGAEVLPGLTAQPPLVAEARKRSAWLRHLSGSQPLNLYLHEVRTLGARLGSGEYMSQPSQTLKSYVERQEDVLYVVGPDDLSDAELKRQGCKRAHHVRPEEFVGIQCSLTRDDGSEIAPGIIDHFDVSRGALTILTPLSNSVVVRTVRMGTTVIGRDGTTKPFERPWIV